MSERRVLDFASIQEIMPEVDRLLSGYKPLGTWTLGQTCNHLAKAIRYSADSPAATEPATREHEMIRTRFFRGRFPDNRPAPEGMIPRPDLEDAAEVEKLREAIERFKLASGAGPLHPVIGPLTHEDWERFHCMHAAHHLGFKAPIS